MKKFIIMSMSIDEVTADLHENEEDTSENQDDNE